jgi:hypothetical protein
MRCDERVSSCRATRRSGTRCHRLHGLVQLERGDKGRITPKITHDRVELDLPLIGSRDTDQSRKVG